MAFMGYFDDREAIKTEFLLHGRIIGYDACSSSSVGPIRELYNANHFEYIGSSFYLILNNKITRWDKMRHFFKHKD